MSTESPEVIARRILRGGKFTLQDLALLQRSADSEGHVPLAYAEPVTRDLAKYFTSFYRSSPS